jgi:ferredoxin
MATIITSECINCGACESECPNTAIYQGGVEWELNGAMHPAIATDVFYIVPDKCTECVGFFDHEACAAVCPVDCCIPDPNNLESEDALLARAKQLHPDETFGAEFPSRFKKESAAGAPTPAATTAAVPAAPLTPATAPVTAAVPAAPVAVPPAPVAAPAAPVAAPAAPVAAPTAPVAAPPVPNAAPPVKPTPVTSPGPTSAGIPEIEEWEVPIECFRCHGTYAVAFRHFRSGVVFYCPFCQGSYVVTTSMRSNVSHALRDFHKSWSTEFDSFQERRQRELAEFEERQHAKLEAFNDSLKRSSHEFKPPGAPRKRAWIFG